MYKIIEFPEIQKYQEEEGFEKNTCLINDADFMIANNIGVSAYFVNIEWMESIDHKDELDQAAHETAEHLEQ